MFVTDISTKYFGVEMAAIARIILALAAPYHLPLASRHHLRVPRRHATTPNFEAFATGSDLLRLFFCCEPTGAPGAALGHDLGPRVAGTGRRPHAGVYTMFIYRDTSLSTEDNRVSKAKTTRCEWSVSVVEVI